jgi:hypothetical protein
LPKGNYDITKTATEQRTGPPSPRRRAPQLSIGTVAQLCNRMP